MPELPQLFVAHSETYDLQLPPQLERQVAVAVALNERVARRLRALAVAPLVVRLRQPIDIEHNGAAGPLPDVPRRALLLSQQPGRRPARADRGRLRRLRTRARPPGRRLRPGRGPAARARGRGDRDRLWPLGAGGDGRRARRLRVRPLRRRRLGHGGLVPGARGGRLRRSRARDDGRRGAPARPTCAPTPPRWARPTATSWWPTIAPTSTPRSWSSCCVRSRPPQRDRLPHEEMARLVRLEWRARVEAQALRRELSRRDEQLERANARPRTPKRARSRSAATTSRR